MASLRVDPQCADDQHQGEHQFNLGLTTVIG